MKKPENPFVARSAAQTRVRRLLSATTPADFHREKLTLPVREAGPIAGLGAQVAAHLAARSPAAAPSVGRRPTAPNPTDGYTPGEAVDEAELVALLREAIDADPRVSIAARRSSGPYDRKRRRPTLPKAVRQPKSSEAPEPPEPLDLPATCAAHKGRTGTLGKAFKSAFALPPTK